MTGLPPEQTQAVSITLPDGSQCHFDRPVAVTEVAAAIGAGLARNTVAGKLGGRLVDACDVIDHNAAPCRWT